MFKNPSFHLIIYYIKGNNKRLGNFLTIQHLNVDLFEDNDLALWQRFTEGNTVAYEGLYHKYVKDLYRYANMVVRNQPLAEDVIHDVFADLWRNRKGLGKIRSVRLYLFSSVKRRALRKLKKESAFTCLDFAQDDFSFEVAPCFLDELVDIQHKDTISKRIKKGIADLSNRQREIIYLRFYQDMSYAEIAQLLKLDQKYVYNLASKAFGILRKSISSFLSIIFLFS